MTHTIRSPVSRSNPSSPLRKRRIKRANSCLEKTSKLFLKHKWTFFYDERPVTKIKPVVEYESAIKTIGTFHTVQGFWQYNNSLVAPSKFPTTSNLRLFKEHIKPMWEDPHNLHGGKWTIPFEKSQTNQAWMTIVLAIIGEQFQHSEDICGVVLSTRAKIDTIHVWFSKSYGMSCDHFVEETSNELRKLLKIPAIQSLSFKSHQQALDQTSTLRNSTGKLNKSSSRNRRSVDSYSKGSIPTRSFSVLNNPQRNYSSCDLSHQSTTTTNKTKKSTSLSSSQFTRINKHIHDSQLEELTSNNQSTNQNDISSDHSPYNIELKIVEKKGNSRKSTSFSNYTTNNSSILSSTTGTATTSSSLLKFVESSHSSTQNNNTNHSINGNTVVAEDHDNHKGNSLICDQSPKITIPMSSILWNTLFCLIVLVVGLTALLISLL